METRRKVNKQLDIGDRRKVDRRSGADRRSGWDKTEGNLLRGTLAATASMVFQFSRPFTIILGYVDLLLNRSKEKHTKQKLVIIKEQLEIISEILDDFREVDNFKTKNFDGMEILDTKRLMEEEPNKLDRKIL
jgi:signal transduction histidine kinase